MRGSKSSSEPDDGRSRKAELSPLNENGSTIEDLDTLLRGVTPENRHPEWDTGPRVGNEAW